MAGPQGKLPALSPAGRAWLTLAMVLLIIGGGTGSWMLAACGFTVLGALLTLYLRFMPIAVVVWRRYLELVWWVERPPGGGTTGLLAQRPFSLQVALRNLGPIPLGRAELRLLRSSCIDVSAPPPPLPLPPRSEASARMELVAQQAGAWFLHGAAIRLHDAAGLCHVEAYFPLATPLRVLPRHGARQTLPGLRLSAGAPDDRLGVHALSHKGLGGELRELREYVPGDPFKLIAWKASARVSSMGGGRLLVRELDRETLVSHLLILDIGAGMRSGRPGSWKLDHAVELCESYARAVIEGGDSVGLIAVDGEIHSSSRPAGGPVHRLRLTEQLLSVMAVSDPRLCGVGDDELCAQVARYLRQQEGLEARVSRPPPIDDAQAWAKIQVGPGEDERYDLGKLGAAARRILGAAYKDRGLGGRSAETPELSGLSDLAALRQLCLQRGIELPYRGAVRAGGRSRAAGFAEALRRAARVPGAQVVIVSDLDGLEEIEGSRGEIAAAAAACRRRGQTLICLFPESRRYLPRDLVRGPGAARAAEIFGWEIGRKECATQAALSRLGVHVVPMGPEDGLAQILGRLASKRAGRNPPRRRGSAPRETPAQDAPARARR